MSRLSPPEYIIREVNRVGERPDFIESAIVIAACSDLGCEHYISMSELSDVDLLPDLVRRSVCATILDGADQVWTYLASLKFQAENALIVHLANDEYLHREGIVYIAKFPLLRMPIQQ